MSSRLLGSAAAGLTAVLALGSVSASPANAADAAPSTYLCAVAGQQLPLFVSPTAAPAIPPLASGFTIPADSAPIGVNFTVPAAVLTGLKNAVGATQLGASSSDFGIRVGSAGSIPVSGLAAPMAAIPESGDLLLAATGTNGSFQLPAAGTYDLLLPASFTAVVSTDKTGNAISGTCTLQGESPVLGSMTVSKQDSTTTAVGPKATIKKGKPAKVTATVAGAFKDATGKVTAKEGSKKLGTAVLKKGKATFTIKGLKPGAHEIVVSYGGDKSTNASAATAVLVLVSK